MEFQRHDKEIAANVVSVLRSTGFYNFQSSLMPTHFLLSGETDLSLMGQVKAKALSDGADGYQYCETCLPMAMLTGQHPLAESEVSFTRKQIAKLANGKEFKMDGYELNSGEVAALSALSSSMSKDRAAVGGALLAVASIARLIESGVKEVRLGVDAALRHFKGFFPKVGEYLTQMYPQANIEFVILDAGKDKGSIPSYGAATVAAACAHAYDLQHA